MTQVEQPVTGHRCPKCGRVWAAKTPRHDCYLIYCLRQEAICPECSPAMMHAYHGHYLYIGGGSEHSIIDGYWS